MEKDSSQICLFDQIKSLQGLPRFFTKDLSALYQRTNGIDYCSGIVFNFSCIPCHAAGVFTLRRVVITGLGMVAPNGNNVATAWGAALAGQSGIARISLFDPSPHKVQIAGEVKNLDVSACLSPEEDKVLTRFIRFATVAAHEALQDSGLEIAE